MTGVREQVLAYPVLSTEDGAKGKTLMINYDPDQSPTLDPAALKEAVNHGTGESMRRHAAFFAARCREGAGTMVVALREGWVDRETLDRLASELEAWAET